MKKKIFGYSVFSLFVIFGIIYLRNNYQLEMVEPSYSFSEDFSQSKELAEVSMADGVKQIEFKYKNTSQELQHITSLYTSCMCTKAKIQIGEETSSFAGMKGHKSGLMPINPDMILDPGETATIFVEFDPNAHGPEATGPFTRSVFLGSDSSNQATEFTFTGTIIK